MKNEIIILPDNEIPPELISITDAALVGCVMKKDGDTPEVLPGLLSKDEIIEAFYETVDENLLRILFAGHVNKITSAGKISYLRRAKVRLYCHSLTQGAYDMLQRRTTKFKISGYMFRCE